MTETVGLVGLGAMGSAMAIMLVKAGYDVVGFDVRKPRRKLSFKIETKSAAPRTRWKRCAKAATPFCRACPII